MALGKFYILQLGLPRSKLPETKDEHRRSVACRRPALLVCIVWMIYKKQ